MHLTFVEGMAWLRYGGEDLWSALQAGDSDWIESAIADMGYGIEQINLAKEMFDEARQ